MKRAVNLITIAACLALLLAAFARPADACRNCHKEAFKKKSLHPPVLQGCAVCHENITTSQCLNEHVESTKYGLSAPLPGLCLRCHDAKKFENDRSHGEMPSKCAGCHDPHSSDASKLLVLDVPALCIKCHGKRPFEGKVVHKPLLEGKCLSCHKFHTRTKSYLLAMDEPDLCYTCHSKSKLRDTRHSPVAAEQCTSCHNPHSSEKPSMLAAGLNFMCMKCHKALGNLAPQHDRIGFPIKDLSCISCHNPHNQDWKLMMKLNNLKSGLARKNHSCNFCKTH
ncbi:MAG: hypothetical protein HY880_01770 [Deltaproteobacteria bacterium]|nr:hypothetical protein [Deltaproteobacteria bacterium]